MLRMNFIKQWSVVLLLAWSSTCFSEDIDLFLADPDVIGDGPNVLFVIDSGASWNSQAGAIGGWKIREMVLDAMHHVLIDPELTGKVNLGLMPFSAGNSPKGGKVLIHAKPLDAARQAGISCRLYSTAPGESGICPAVQGEEILGQGNNSPYALTLNEAYRYFMGLSPMSGLQDGVFSGTNLNGYDPDAISGGRYVSPAYENPCVDNFIIVIGSGDPDSGENNAAETELNNLGGRLSSDPIDLSPNDSYQSSWGDEYARFLSTVDVVPDIEGSGSIITYVIDVFDPDSNQRNTRSFKGARAFYQSMARQGKGKYFAASDKDQIAAAITQIMEEIQAVNSVFASVSLPISVNVQGTNQNQVYIGMFRPDRSKLPMWVGNLKRYQYLFDVNQHPYLAGVDELAAYNPVTGFISPSAVSFWTEDSTYWAFHDEYTASDRPDGQIVEKGATAQRLRERAASRQMLTCPSTGCGANFVSFTAANTSLDADVVNWAIGADVLDETDDGNTNIRRPSIHGDVLHSRPAVVNYHRTATVDNGDDVVIFYGSNDGVFRAVDGSTGEELWSLILREHYPLLQTLYKNVRAEEGSPWRPYAVDGNPVVISIDVNGDGRLKHEDGDKVYLYLTMRRGGRMIYAIDVSDPDSPKPMWNVNSDTVGFSELGQTWSSPTAAYIRAHTDEHGNPKPVLIFGLGYDPVDDNVKPTLASRSMGRGIMVVDAIDGTRLWQAGPSPDIAVDVVTKTVVGMQYAIPSDVRLVNRSGNVKNFAEYLYVGDTGGNVWRVNISSDDMADWDVHQLASVGGCGGEVDCRKFLYPPSIVFGDSFDYILMGTGDREKPFDKTVTNRFYMFKDKKDNITVTEAAMLDVTESAGYYDEDNGVPDESVIDKYVDTALLDASMGWYVTFYDIGEKTIGNAITIGGTTIFYTNLPAGSNRDEEGNISSCVSSLGTARQYFVDYKTGAAINVTESVPERDDRFVVVPGGGFPPPPVAMTLINPNTGRPWTGLAGLNPVSPAGDSSGKRKRTFWYKLSD